MEATVSPPFQGLVMETGWVSLTQAVGRAVLGRPFGAGKYDPLFPNHSVKLGHYSVKD